jgi:hypothetical protein
MFYWVFYIFVGYGLFCLSAVLCLSGKTCCLVAEWNGSMDPLAHHNEGWHRVRLSPLNEMTFFLQSSTPWWLFMAVQEKTELFQVCIIDFYLNCLFAGISLSVSCWDIGQTFLVCLGLGRQFSAHSLTYLWLLWLCHFHSCILHYRAIVHCKLLLMLSISTLDT